ncbi:CBS domain-containing protein [Polynucleobacter paneuropaeus]|nr:CBS domain-containing protein [Polynucleobacter paneuropaeus]
MKVIDLLREKGGAVSTVPKSMKLSECVIMMSDKNLGSLIVIDNGLVSGLLTFREVINILAQRQKELRRGPTPPVAELTVGAVMISNPVTASLTDEIADIHDLMVSNHQRYVPVMQNEKLVGIISFYDIAKVIIESSIKENELLKSYINDFPDIKD